MFAYVWYMILYCRLKMSKNALSSILDKNQLTGENYNDWKRNLDIVLSFEKLKYVLTTPCPPEPTGDSSNEQFQAYDRWKDANDQARCYVMASMNNVLKAQHQDYETAK